MKYSKKLIFIFVAVVVLVATAIVILLSLYFFQEKKEQISKTDESVIKCQNVYLKVPDNYKNLEIPSAVEKDKNGCRITDFGCLCVRKKGDEKLLLDITEFKLKSGNIISDFKSFIAFKIKSVKKEFIGRSADAIISVAKEEGGNAHKEDFNFLGFSAVKITDINNGLITKTIIFVRYPKWYIITFSASGDIFDEYWAETEKSLNIARFE